MRVCALHRLLLPFCCRSSSITRAGSSSSMSSPRRRAARAMPFRLATGMRLASASSLSRSASARRRAICLARGSFLTMSMGCTVSQTDVSHDNGIPKNPSEVSHGDPRAGPTLPTSYRTRDTAMVSRRAAMPAATSNNVAPAGRPGTAGPYASPRRRTPCPAWLPPLARPPSRGRDETRHEVDSGLRRSARKSERSAVSDNSRAAPITC